MNPLDLFKRLPHLNGDKKVIEDWGYIPNLYHFDTKWHVSWIHYDDGSAFIDFEGETPEEAIQKAFNWCIELKLINEIVDVAESSLKTFPRVNMRKKMIILYILWFSFVIIAAYLASL